MGWIRKKVPCVGSALFRGGLPPRLEELRPQLEAAGARVEPRPAAGDEHWRAHLQHDVWGSAEAVCRRQFVRTPAALVDFDARLLPSERAAACAADHGVDVRLDGARGHVLRDRKHMLRYLQALLDPYDHDAIAVDRLATKFWSRAALADELAHDADLDVESMFIAHLVYDPAVADGEAAEGEDRSVYWLHTHGLAELGAHDFDVLRPSPVLMGNGYDVLLSIAYQVLEGQIAGATPRAPVFAPGGDVGFVDVARFMREAPADERALRDAEARDPTHHGGRRLVACDPLATGLIGRLLGRAGVRASRALSVLEGDHFVTPFTTAATELMARRARHTFATLVSMASEFSEFEVKPLVKLGVRTDSAQSDDDREHLWFEVHGFPASDRVDATLLNQPFDVARLHEGARGVWDVDLLSDWKILTPAGEIGPRGFHVARRLRLVAPRLREWLAEHGRGDSAG